MLSFLKKIFQPEPKQTEKSKSTPEEVGEFYNNSTDKFIEVYGETIQAFRTNKIEDYLDYTIEQASLKDDLKVLDAGCGIGGPSSYFASKINSEFTGITISKEQVKKAQELLKTKTLKGSVSILQGDYHKLDELFPVETFDTVLFLESFGHSYNHAKVIEQTHKVLKPGGILYIKDLFKREHPSEEDGKRIDRIIDEINKAYRYNIADLYEVLKTVRRLNFILLSVKTPEIKIGEFEHLTISNDFQNLFDISKIISWDEYVFPIDFYEIKVMKAPFDVNKDKHLYFLNNPFTIDYFKGE